MRPSRVRAGARGIALSLVLGALAVGSLGSAGVASAAPPSARRCIDNAENGQQLRAAGKLAAARKAFGVCTAVECPAAIRKDCGRWIDELEGAIPTVSVRLEDETGAEGHGKILLDNETFASDPGGLATRIDPGMHHFTWVRSPDKNVELEVTLREGEKNRVIVLRAEGSGASPPPAGKSAEHVTLPPTPPPKDDGDEKPSVIPWVVGGAGVAAGVVGMALWLVGLDQKSTLEQSCLPTNSCSRSDVDASKNKLVVGDILVGLGVLAVGTAVYLIFKPTAAPTHAAQH